jgi:hypothetical protein
MRDETVQTLNEPTNGELTDALIGAPVNELTVDELLDLYQHYSEAETAARNSRIKVAAALAARSPQQAGCRTTRVRGDRRRAKIEWPDDSWDQSRLREAWNAYPTFRDEFLTIATLRVRLREYGKALRESGPESFETFKGMLTAANRGPQGILRIVIEE